MADAAILQSRKIDISLQQFNRYGRNLALFYRANHLNADDRENFEFKKQIQCGGRPPY